MSRHHRWKYTLASLEMQAVRVALAHLTVVEVQSDKHRATHASQTGITYCCLTRQGCTVDSVTAIVTHKTTEAATNSSNVASSSG